MENKVYTVGNMLKLIEEIGRDTDKSIPCKYCGGTQRLSSVYKGDVQEHRCYACTEPTELME